MSLPAIFKFSKLLLKISVIGKKMAIPKSSIVTQRNEDNKTRNIENLLIPILIKILK